MNESPPGEEIERIAASRKKAGVRGEQHHAFPNPVIQRGDAKSVGDEFQPIAAKNADRGEDAVVRLRRARPIVENGLGIAPAVHWRVKQVAAERNARQRGIGRRLMHQGPGGGMERGDLTQQKPLAGSRGVNGGLRGRAVNLQVGVRAPGAEKEIGVIAVITAMRADQIERNPAPHANGPRFFPQYYIPRIHRKTDLIAC